MKPDAMTILTIAALAITFSGCKSYEKAAPVDWAEESRLENPVITLSSPEDAARLALVGNPELNMMRLEAAGKANIAKETGWWEDPELDFDILRIIESADHPFLGGANVKFTIPLSGVNKATKKAAEAYHAVELEKIKAAERRIAAKAETTAVAIYFKRKKAETLAAYENDANIKRAAASAEKLHRAGEYTLIDLNGVRRHKHAREHERMDLENGIEELENSFRSLAGLHPETRIAISFSLPSPGTRGIEKPDMISLTAHPEVKTVLAELERSEAELETEILRQYPELKIGPLAGNEEGNDRVGMVAGITLPLWNRNRKAIAESEAERDGKRLNVVNVWRNLALTADAAYAKCARLLNHPPPPPGEAKYAERLLDAGEMSPIEYLSTREEILRQNLEEISWQAAVAEAMTELDRYILK